MNQGMKQAIFMFFLKVWLIKLAAIAVMFAVIWGFFWLMSRRKGRKRAYR